MLRDEIIEIIDNAIVGGTHTHDYGFDEIADQILALIAPELEKAKLWNGAMDVIQNFHATDRRNRNMNMVEIINYVEDLEKALTDALEGEKNAKKV